MEVKSPVETVTFRSFRSFPRSPARASHQTRADLSPDAEGVNRENVPGHATGPLPRIPGPPDGTIPRCPAFKVATNPANSRFARSRTFAVSGVPSAAQS